MIDSITAAEQLLKELNEKYYSEEEYNLELEYKNRLQLTCKTEYRDFEPVPLYLPMTEQNFEEEVARLADNAHWALSPVIDPNIEIEGL